MILLDKGADQNIQGKEDGYTALIRAIINNRDGIATALILRDDTKLDLQDVEGNTALHHACVIGNESIVCILLFRGIDRTIKNKEGKTALECCAGSAIKLFFKDYEQINKVNIPAKENKCVDISKKCMNFHVPPKHSQNVKFGKIGSYYQKWDKTFMCWKRFKLIPIYSSVGVNCEYVDEKISFHLLGDDMIRLDCIYKKDGSVKRDLYD
jgi:hypothetical protein